MCRRNMIWIRFSRLHMMLVVVGIVLVVFYAARGQYSIRNTSMTDSSHSVGNEQTSRAPLVRLIMTGQNRTRAQVSDCQWVTRTGEAPYYLTAVVSLRIRKESKSKTTTRELKQWLQYMRYIGVEHVYLYDAFLTPDECQEKYLTKFVSEGFVTYTDWHKYNPFSLDGTQVKAYQDCIDRFGNQSQWQVAVDLDEYPFSPSDTKPGFLSRFVKNFKEKTSETSEITMNNYLFLGKPLQEEFLFQRIWRRTPKPANHLVKPIYRPVRVQAQLHHNYLKSGHSIIAPDGQLRMNHYWGARLQNWGEDTPKVIGMTQEDRSMEDVLKVYLSCEQWLRKYLE